MGADTFTQIAKGKTAEEAFRVAREEALHEYGHGRYTGSIAEKRSFVMIRDTPRDLKLRLDEAIDMLKAVLREEHGAEALLTDGERLDAFRRQLPVETYLDAVAGNLRVGARAKQALRAEITRLRGLKARCKARIAPIEIADLLIEMGDPRVRDKWGPAGCIDLAPKREGDKEFLFFGWASS